MAGKSPVTASDEQRAGLLGLADSGEADRARAVLLTLAGADAILAETSRGDRWLSTRSRGHSSDEISRIGRGGGHRRRVPSFSRRAHRRGHDDGRGYDLQNLRLRRGKEDKWRADAISG